MGRVYQRIAQLLLPRILTVYGKTSSYWTDWKSQATQTNQGKERDPDQSGDHGVFGDRNGCDTADAQ